MHIANIFFLSLYGKDSRLVSDHIYDKYQENGGRSNHYVMRCLFCQAAIIYFLFRKNFLSRGEIFQQVMQGQNIITILIVAWLSNNYNRTLSRKNWFAILVFQSLYQKVKTIMQIKLSNATNWNDMISTFTFESDTEIYALLEKELPYFYA